MFEELSAVSIQQQEFKEWLTSKTLLSLNKMVRDIPLGDIADRINDKNKEIQELTEQNEERLNKIGKKKKND